MFVSVKGIANAIDVEIAYVVDAIENHESVTDEEYREYLRTMRGKLTARLAIMKLNSTDRRLLDRYSRKVDRCVARIDSAEEDR